MPVNQGFFEIINHFKIINWLIFIFYIFTKIWALVKVRGSTMTKKQKCTQEAKELAE